MELVTANQAVTYVVDNVEIVTPDNVSVLRATAVPTLTLVTCYPFYFVGSAPQRYIVHASIVAADRNGRAQTDSPQEDSQRDLNQFTSTQLNRTGTHGPEQ
jgi:sortase (surface protein transpeptidase)